MDESLWPEIGRGGEAYVLKGELTQIKGLGGILSSEKPITVAKRINLGSPVYNYQGHETFCINVILRILDEYFKGQKEYSHNHIPRPLGSFNDREKAGYYYEFVEGNEGFPSLIMYADRGQVLVGMEEWNEFCGLFNSFGFVVDADKIESSDANYKNILLHGSWNQEELDITGKHHPRWKRIDFGYSSLPFKYEKFLGEMERYHDVLGGRYELTMLSARYCKHENLTQGEIKELENSVLQFRKDMISEII